MTKSIKKFFNMVEVTLAIAVVGIGIAGIMSLFPVAVSASRDAIADNYAADTADQMIAYISIISKADWATFIAGSSVPDESSIPSDPISSLACATDTGLENIKASGTSGIFKITQGSGNGIVDFSAFIKVWRTQLPQMNIAGQVTNVGWDSTFLYGSGVHIEISYPAEAPAAGRKKINYYFEVFKN
ncbi:MAG: hypothetical protein A2020_03270 [Lentisphaerae bacterium GWF2_45_14]|nr:MAG: hypothetical protein A2020_03270 [Lentisphaerae bacterium GWF2_45_14]